MTRAFLLLAFSFSLLRASTLLGAADWFVATHGRPTASGTKEAPWDLESALGGKQQIAPGDTVWIRGGTYKYPPKVGGHGYPIKLAGREGAPIHVRASAGERVSIDGGVTVQEPSTYLWIWDLEILVSEPRPDKPLPPDPSYQNVNRPWGGLNVYSGTGCKFINLIIHDNSQGVSWWSGSRDSELHGCIIYDNGWAGTDRGHGHAIYTQNQEGVKTISDCIMTGGFGYTMHAYGSSRAYVDNYLVEGNIAYDAGTFLIGGGRPSRDIRVLTNFLSHVPMQIGYSAPTNQNCIVRGNVIVNRGLTIKNFEQVVNEGNLVLPEPTTPRPRETQVMLRPNRYDPRRANVAIFNWEKKSEAQIPALDFLRPGENYRLMNPRNFFGEPVVQGTFNGRDATVPMTGEFAVFVLLKEQ